MLLKILKFTLIGLFLLLSSCFSFTTDSYKKDSVDFSKYNKISLLNIESNIEQLPSQEITDTIALKFMQKGFSVIQNKHLKVMLDQDTLRLAGFNENTRKMLKLQDVNAIITGTLTGYQKKIVPNTTPINPSWFQQVLPQPLNNNECKVFLSIIMFDVNTGDTIWFARGQQIKEAENLKVDTLLNEILLEMSFRFPSTKENGKWFGIF